MALEVEYMMEYHDPDLLVTEKSLLFHISLPLLSLGTLVRGCRCATPWCDLDFTFDLAVVNLTYKILSGLYLGNHKV